ncbi:IS1/IS1595 family N-terminal zinc-binding domain-containing protein [Leptolyngbya sp. AN03gr2]
MNCPRCGSDRVSRNGYNRLKSGNAPKRYCPKCRRTFQEQKKGK